MIETVRFWTFGFAAPRRPTENNQILTFGRSSGGGRAEKTIWSGRSGPMEEGLGPMEERLGPMEERLGPMEERLGPPCEAHSHAPPDATALRMIPSARQGQTTIMRVSLIRGRADDTNHRDVRPRGHPAKNNVALAMQCWRLGAPFQKQSGF